MPFPSTGQIEAAWAALPETVQALITNSPDLKDLAGVLYNKWTGDPEVGKEAVGLMGEVIVGAAAGAALLGVGMPAIPALAAGYVAGKLGNEAGQFAWNLLTDPNFGYTFNPEDGRWYKVAPAPAHGQFAWEGPATSLNDPFTRARQWRYTDPLVLDLDGDGIETVGATGYSTVLFDHDGDGTKTGTGWVKSDDGLLVWDRNGNGLIDSGAELFGVDTVLASGQKAADGFAALADLDSSHDGKFDAADSAYADLRIWRDLNQDGISQANELKSLLDSGIATIGLAATASTVNLGNGNTQTATAGYTRTDGTTGTAANLNLVQNAFYREFGDTIAVSATAALLPGMVRGAANDGIWGVAA